MKPLRLGLIATHPVQYQVPWFRALQARPEVDLTVLYAHLPSAQEQGTGFGVAFDWDLPLLEGYPYELLRNVASPPALSTFRGSDTPDVGRNLRELRLDAVIVNGWHAKSCLQALWACRRLGLPCIVRGDSNALKPRPLHVRLVHRVLLAQYAAFLTVGRSNAEFYRRNGVPEHKLFFGPHCVDNARFLAQAGELQPQRAALRAAWGIPAQGCVFLFCGKLVPKKRPQDVVAAVGQARQAGVRAHLLVAGDGELRAACEAQARATGVPVTFAGFLNQTEVARAYVASDALVLPSDHGETWGLVVNEAMACGRPALVSDRVGCHADLVVPGQTGEVFAFGDVAALAELVQRLSGDPGGLAALGAGARARVAAYSVDALVKGTLEAAAFVTARTAA